MEMKHNIEEERLYAEAHKFPELTGEPEVGKWYRITMPECRNAKGNAHYVSLRKGTDTKRMVIMLMGGGASWNAYTAARPLNLENLYEKDREAFYFDDSDPLTDIGISGGTVEKGKENPFDTWNMISVNYSTGDFHIGQNEYTYEDLEGNTRTLYHHGYSNMQTSIQTALKYMEMPEEILLQGGSAGGFGVSALADQIFEMFPNCQKFTCYIDASLFSYNFYGVARDIWKAPERIYSRLKTDNFILDGLTAIHEKYGDRFTYLYSSALRDAELSRFQTALDGKKTAFSKASGDFFMQNLKKTVISLSEIIPKMGFYIYKGDIFPGTKEEDCLMQHGIFMTDSFWKTMGVKISGMEWLWNAVNGNVEKIGLDLFH